MISVSQLKEKAERKYWSVLKACLSGESLFPLSIPADRKLPGSFQAIHRVLGELVENSKEKRGYGYCLTFRERKTRRHGTQSVPTLIFFDSENDFFRFIGRKGEAEKILHRAEELRGEFPELEQWVEQNPQKILKYLDEWENIIKVLHYFRENPRPGMYIRELPVKVHTKFIEGYKAILAELLEYIIPGHIDRNGDTFEKRFHLKSPELLIRLRRLDTTIDKIIFTLSDDLGLPAAAFNRMNPQARYVVITENQLTFLTLPSLDNTIAVYGGGFKVENLKEAGWLQSKTVIYWGDIDMHGFLILSMVRRYFPSVISVMMDEETFLRFRGLCGVGVGSMERDDKKLNLTPEELKLYRLVREGDLRLEQEHLPQEYTSKRLKWLLGKILHENC